jgi:hypothetical protein
LWHGFLVCFASQDAWDVPRGHWHTEGSPAPPVSEVRVSAYLSSVRPRGGGTLIVVGSHRIAGFRRGTDSGKDYRGRLMDRFDWFRGLWRGESDEDRIDKYMIQGAVVDGVDACGWLNSSANPATSSFGIPPCFTGAA